MPDNYTDTRFDSRFLLSVIKTMASQLCWFCNHLGNDTHPRPCHGCGIHGFKDGNFASLEKTDVKETPSKQTATPKWNVVMRESETAEPKDIATFDRADDAVIFAKELTDGLERANGFPRFDVRVKQ